MTGINLAGQWDEPWADWKKPVMAKQIAAFKAAGISTIRIPVDWSIVDPTDRIAIAPIQALVQEAFQTGIKCIIDAHGNKAFLADPKGQQSNFVNMWGFIARAFADFRWNVEFDLLNEPIPPAGKPALSNQDLLNLLGILAPPIRTISQSRRLYMGGNWANDYNHILTIPSTLANVGSTFHYYEPMDFSHAGLSWVTDPATGKPFPIRKWGTQADLDHLAQTRDNVEAFIKQTGQVPLLGEFGANEQIPLADRCTYIAAVKKAFGSLGCECLLWGFQNSFVITGADGNVRPEILKALA